MFEVIKGSNPFTNVVIDGEALINNRIPGLDVDEEDEKSDEGLSKGENENKEDQGPKISFEELEALREQYRKDGQEYAVAMHKKADQELTNAKEEAERIMEEAKDKGRRLLDQIDEKLAETLEEARKKGASEGYDDGLKRGEEDGYIQGLKKCKETLLDLKKLCEDFEKEKAELMAENRRGIFDLALGIAEKVTAVTFAQKDKKALEKMIAAAAKEFRNTKNIRVTLSKLDLSEDMEADFKIYEKCFSPTTNVEFEAIDAESGTLMLESDSEILDAGVSTQLKMIGELGRGRFREKEPTPDSEEVVEQIKETKTSKSRAAKGTKSAKSAKKSSQNVCEAAPDVPMSVSEPVIQTNEINEAQNIQEEETQDVQTVLTDVLPDTDL